MNAGTQSVLLPVISLQPPIADDFLRLIIEIIVTIIHLPPDPLTNIRSRLFGSVENVWKGRDVFQMFAQHPYQFFEATGETPESMLEIVNDLRRRWRSRHNHILSPRNRVMLFMLWLRSYPSYAILSLLFDVSPGTIGHELDELRPMLHATYVNSIRWPSVAEWRNARGNWEKLPDAVAAIDGTSHHIYRPQTEPQQLYYSGHRHQHCIHTIIIIDNTNTLRYVHSGFLGHQNDAQIFNSLPNIGANEQLSFPDECFILGDKIFPNRYPLMTPYSRPEITRQPVHRQHLARKFNRIHSRYRVTVEHVIREVKMYRSIGTLWRHPRYKIRQTVDICSAMAFRRKKLFS